MRILVLGDFIEDRYVFSTATRICPEAPVPVIVPHDERVSDGGAGLVKAQLTELGCDVHSDYGSESKKTRFFVGNHLVLRLDQDSIRVRGFLPFMPFEDNPLNAYDAIVVSDYGKGAVTEEMARMVVETGKPVFCDAKPHWHWFAGKNVTIFPNDREAGTAPAVIDPTQIFHSCEYGRIVHKLGKDGCRLQEPGRDIRLPATVSEVVDVCGAGDTFMAAFVWAWSLQLPAEDSLRLANILAGEACTHLGTYVVPRQFAEAELGKIRAAKESGQQVSASFHDSTREVLRQQLLSGQQNAYRTSESGNFPSDWSREPTDPAGAPCIPPLWQTPPTDHTDPNASSAIPIPADQRNSDSPSTKWKK